MDPVSLLPPLAATSLALATAFFLGRFLRGPATQGRMASIDGLRGLLAFFVFLHHACIWYFYLRTGRWEVPPSGLYTHFGQASVTLFFMITGLLFADKLLDGRKKPIDWQRLFVGRVLRLAPLYLAVMMALVFIVAVLSGGQLVDSLPKLLIGLARWLAFTIAGGPDLNGINMTGVIVAGVTWSLRYEWLFYLALPVLALPVRVVPPHFYLAVAAASVGYAIAHPSIHYVSFLGGIAAALLLRSSAFVGFARSPIASVLALLALAAVGLQETSYTLEANILLAVFFVVVACGNTLFGALVHHACRTLGEFAYGIYLMHGVVLFVTFRFIIGFDQARQISPFQHWFVVALLTPVLVALSFLAFRFIERPALSYVPLVNGWVTGVQQSLRYRRRSV